MGLCGTKYLVKMFIPPIFWKIVKDLFLGKVDDATDCVFQGDYPDWQSAIAACGGGYDSDAIFQKVVAAARKVRDGEALWERDSVCFYHEEYNWPLLASLMHIAALQGGKLHVLDFGGALGSTYRQHKKFLDSLPDFSWSIVEQSHVVACGQNEFTTDKLSFYHNMDECYADKDINCVLFSSVLQYLPEPYAVVEEVMRKNPFAILIDRTPFLADSERITVQNVPEEIYKARLPCRFFDQNKFDFLDKYELGVVQECSISYNNHLSMFFMKK